MNRENKPLFLYTFITVFGGLIVGLNMAGISGAVPFLQEQFMIGGKYSDRRLPLRCFAGRRF